MKAKTADTQPMDVTPGIQPGIKRLAWIDDPSQLQSHPGNWRRHPDRQTKALITSIKENGWAGALLFNKTTGNLVDGHLRKKISLKELKHLCPIPVLIGTWTEAQERRLLATLDPISAMAEADTELLRKLTSELDADLESATAKMDAESKQVFRTVAKELESQAEAIDYGGPSAFFPSDEEEFGSIATEPQAAPALEDRKGTMEGSFRLKTRSEIDWDAWGPGSVLDIPNLRADRLGAIPEPIVTWLGDRDSPPCDHYLYVWGSTALGDVGPHVLPCFYTEDDKFNRVWDSPETYTANLLKYGVTTIVSTNFSCYDGMHKAEDVWQTYRARWLSRYWQEAGIRIVPDLMLGNLVQDEVWQWRFAGIPEKAPAVALQIQQKGEAQPELYYRQRHRQLLKVLDMLRPESLLLYRGPSVPEWFIEKLPSSLHVVTCDSFMSGRSALIKRKRQKSISRQQTDVPEDTAE